MLSDKLLKSERMTIYAYASGVRKHAALTHLFRNILNVVIPYKAKGYYYFKVSTLSIITIHKSRKIFVLLNHNILLVNC